VAAERAVALEPAAMARFRELQSRAP